MKTRRILALVLTLTVLLMGLAPTALASVGSGWNDECRGNKSMDAYGNVKYGKHDWVKLTEDPGSSCTSKGVAVYRCSQCGANATRETKAPGHKYGSWKITKQATCTSKGERTRKCRVCGHVDKDTIDRTPHQYGEWTVIEAPTCTSAGRGTHVCTVCGQQTEGRIDKLDHDFSDWQITTPATDFSAGVRTRTCAMCGLTETEDFDPEGTLRRGDRGDAVKALQQGLNDAGYDVGGADGIFGGRTERGVSGLEADNGIAADGIAWPGVQKLLTAGNGAEEAVQPAIADHTLDPIVLLEHAPVGVRAFEEGDTIDITLTATNYSDYPVRFKTLQTGKNESFSDESWMSEPMEPGKPYSFTYYAVMNKDDIAPSCTHREPIVYVIDPETNHEAYDSTYIVIGHQVDAAKIAATPDRGREYKGCVGMACAVPVTVMNVGNVPLEDLTFSWTNAGAARPDDSVDHFSDPSMVGRMEPGDVLTLDYNIFITEEDAQDTYASRMFTVIAKSADGKHKARDAFALGAFILESAQSKVTVEKKETNERPREEGYWPGEKIEYEVSVTNNADREMELVNLYDPLSGEEFDHIGSLTNLQPGRTESRRFEHTVTEGEAQDGFVESAAEAIIEDGIEIWSVESNSVRTPCAPKGDDIDDTEDIPDLELVVIPLQERTAWDEGEEAQFTLRLYNNSDTVLENAAIRTYDGAGGLREEYFPETGTSIAPNDFMEVEDKYVFTSGDAAKSNISLLFRGVGTYDGKWNNDDWSIDYTVNAINPGGGYDWVPPTDPEPTEESVPAPVPEGKPGISITAEDTSGMVCAVDGTVPVKVTVSNTGGTELKDLKLDPSNCEGALWPSGDTWELPSVYVESFMPGEKFNFAYHVTASLDDAALNGTNFDRWLDIIANDAATGEAVSDRAVFWIDLEAEAEPELVLTMTQTSPDISFTADETGYFGTVDYHCKVTNVSDVVTYLETLEVLLYPNPYWVVLQEFGSAVIIQGDSREFDVSLPMYAFNVSPEDPNHVTPKFKAVYHLKDDDTKRDSNKVPFTYRVMVPEPASTLEPEPTLEPVPTREPAPTLEPEPMGGITVVKTVENLPERGFFIEGEVIDFAVTVTNHTGGTILYVAIIDPLCDNPGCILQTFDAIEDGQSETAHLYYTVTKPDVDATRVINTALVNFISPDGTPREWQSNSCEAPTGKVRNIVVTKAVENLPERGFFIEGEVIDFSIHVENFEDEDIYQVDIVDFLSDKPGQIEDTFPVIPAGGGGMIHLYYTVTKQNVGDTFVLNQAAAEYKDASGIPQPPVLSNLVEAPTGELDDPFGVVVTKKVTSKPANGKYYVRNETITYEITVHNSGTITLNDVIVYDTLKGGSGEIASIEIFNPDQTFTYTFSYTVGKSDVKHRKVVNYAWAGWMDEDGGNWDSWSDPVVSRTGEPGEPVEVQDCCVRTLVGLGEGVADYTLYYCHEHRPVAEAVAALIEQAETDEAQLEAWQQAILTWTEALNAEYDRLLDEATDEEKPIILDEKALFFAQLACRRDALALEYADDPAMAAMLVSEQLMNKTADLCYETHTAPEARVDSLTGEHAAIEAAEAPILCGREVTPTDTGAAYRATLCPDHAAVEAAVEAALAGAETPEALTEVWQDAKAQWLAALDDLVNARYLAADAEGRTVLAADRVAYGKWLSTRESFLNLMYPENPEIVGEVMAQTIHDRVMDLCDAVAE